jgi:phenylacetate-CoA ligase
MIFTASEVVTPLMREQIAAGLSAPIYDTYNCWELGHIAAEGREAGHYAIADDCVVVEVLRDDGQPAQEGEAGELVGTNLHFRAMPFIRYRLGDVVTRGGEGAVAGLPFSTLRAIQGRTIDYFELPGGRLLHPWGIMLGIEQIPWIRQYQLLQETQTRIAARIVPHVPPSEQELEALRGLIMVSTGDDVEIVIQLVPEIPPAENGKFRAALSHLHSYYEGASPPG